MPDISTHLMIGAAVALLLGKETDKKQFIMVLLGSIIIDIERPITWLVSDTSFYWLEPIDGFHSILGAVLLSIFAASCFVSKTIDWRTRFGLVFSGAVSHLLMDMTMWPWGELGINLLYPLKIAFSFQLFWPDFMWYPLIGLLILAVTIALKLVLQKFQSMRSIA